MKYLSDILEGLAFTELQGSADMEITSVTFDSRKVMCRVIVCCSKAVPRLMGMIY
jgi:hypothetical protein